MTFPNYAWTLIHIGAGLAALLLPLSGWGTNVALAACATLLTALLLPGLPGHRLVRGADARLPASALYYAVGVLLLVCAFPTRVDLAAAAWGILAAGDGVASIAGRAWGARRWPWNRGKSVAGSIAFVIAGLVMGVALAWCVRHAVTPEPSLRFLVLATLAAVVAAAAIETLPVRLDDNLSVPAASALVFWCAVQFSTRTTEDGGQQLARAVPDGLLLTGAIAVFIWRAGGVSISGAIAGIGLGTLLWAGAGWPGWIMFALAFGAAWATSRMGLARKQILGIAEARDGRRGADNALANCGLAAVAAVAALLTPARDLAWLCLVTALTAAASDTVASEIGKAWGGRTCLVSTMKAVAPGTPGAVSLEGTAAGLAAAFLMALVAWSLGLVSSSALWIVVLAATIGAFVESALAATLGAKHLLNNHLLNFINTLVAVGVALLLQRA
jgi:uncharacterized protein (TIGR00297 family)